MKANLPGHFDGDETKEKRHYKDKGCKYAKSQGYYGPCIDCPLPQCVHDMRAGSEKFFNKRKRKRDIIDRWKKGEPVNDLAISFNLNKRTVQRLIKLYLTTVSTLS